ncbi:glycosyltransferase family 4 protein [Streptomyces mirabilis]|jgi:glycosyltransferase involved in cell wall biosynthesis|uniref:Glycosyl transferases group 1 n=1 Tax=Streptomyces mirabilis TaxID=68239 RepID=A0A1I2RRS3_9ACTN|nr:glycosyltransferase family 4 protein [Streptomyces mirabilis]SFG43222.1 Glycosyl transferases group 1 [Streptomyces mirabilis]
MAVSLPSRRRGEIVHQRRITIVQPYLSHYRVPFFRRLAADLHQQLGAELVVAHSSPPPDAGEDRDRGSADLECAVRLVQHSWRIAGFPVQVRRLGDLPHRSDVVIVEQALHNLETFPLLAGEVWREARGGSGPAVAMWGNGRTCDKEVGPLLQTAKRVLTRQAKWFFAYTAGGADHVAAQGFPRDRITVVRNATDTTALAEARKRVTDEQVAEFSSRHGLVPGRTGLYLGRFHTTKRIPFLLEAVAHIVKRMPEFKLLVAGDGECRSLIEASAARGEGVVYLGPVHDERRALLGAASQLMLMPGMVGLCAVDSFALRTPVMTAAWAYRSPESAEYLDHGRNSLVVEGGPEEYAEAVVKTLSSPRLMTRLKGGCASDADRYTVEGMSARFTEGVAGLLEARFPITSSG